MRMRHKPYAKPELAACPFFVEDAEKARGSWQQLFKKPQPLILELGCGKGGYAAAYASSHPGENYLAVDYLSDVLVAAKRKVEEAYEAKALPPENILLTALNIQWIENDLAPEDKVQRIHINFCNPWPKKSHKKRRLTHTRQLLQYRAFLIPRGEIWFKTDDDELFEESLEYFAQAGFSLRYLSRDLHAAEPDWNIRTEYEQKFADMGVPIKALIAVKEEL